MPLTLNVGLSKKVGLPDYGSLGASCNVQVELESSLLQNDLETFHRHVRNAYVACHQAIHDELARHQHPAANGAASQATQGAGPVAEPLSGNAPARNGNGAGKSNGHRITDKQLDYARQLAGQIRGLGVRRLDPLAGRMYGKTLAELTSLEGSGLIDTLKAVKAGEIGLDAIPQGAAA